MLLRSIVQGYCIGPIANNHPLLVNLEEGWVSISLAFARVRRAGEVVLIRRKNNWYFIGEREITISSSWAPR